MDIWEEINVEGDTEMMEEMNKEKVKDEGDEGMIETIGWETIRVEGEADEEMLKEITCDPLADKNFNPDVNNITVSKNQTPKMKKCGRGVSRAPAIGYIQKYAYKKRENKNHKKEKFCDYCPYRGRPQKSSIEGMHSVMKMESEFKKYVTNLIRYLQPDFLQEDSYLCNSCYMYVKKKYASERGENKNHKKEKFCDYCPYRGRPSQKSSIEKVRSVMKMESELKNYITNEIMYLRPGFLQEDSYLCNSCYMCVKRKYDAYKRGEEYNPRKKIEKPIGGENKIKYNILGDCVICKKKIISNDNNPRFRDSRTCSESVFNELDYAGIQHDDSVLESRVHTTCYQKLHSKNLNIKQRLKKI